MVNSASQRYKTLEKGISRLRRNWLPRTFDPTGSYSERAHDRVIVFRIFAHAEVEQYLEDRVREVALEHQRRWKSTQKPSRVILGLIGYYSGDRKVVSGASSTGLQNLQDISYYVDKGMNELVHQIRSNNGVKEDDILTLLTRVGILAGDLDQTWLNLMNSWGAERGDFVHRSPSLTSRTPDPAAEYATIKDILFGLKSIDIKLSSL